MIIAQLLIIKLSFVYINDRAIAIHGTTLVPTYKVSMHVYPEIKKPSVSIAVSSVDELGGIQPVFIYKPKKLQ